MEDTRSEWQRRIGVGEPQSQARAPTREPRVHRGDGVTTVEVIRERDGGTAGWQHYHDSGRVDATVTPETVRARAHKEGGTWHIQQPTP